MLFLLGLLMGFVAALGLLGFLGWLFLVRMNQDALANFLRGVALVVGYKKPAVVAVEEKEPKKPAVPGVGEKEPKATLGFHAKAKEKL